MNLLNLEDEVTEVEEDDAVVQKEHQMVDFPRNTWSYPPQSQQRYYLARLENLSASNGTESSMKKLT